MNEVIVVTRTPEIRILSMPRTFEAAEEPIVPRLRRRATLLGAVRVAKGRRPVALATGYLDPYVPGKARRQVIVVLTESFTLLCFDHRLRLLWESTLNHLESSLGLGALVPDEASLTVAPTPLQKGDRGVIIVGGSMSLAGGAAGTHMHGHGTDDEDADMSNLQAGRGGNTAPPLGTWRRTW